MAAPGPGQAHRIEISFHEVKSSYVSSEKCAAIKSVVFKSDDTDSAIANGEDESEIVHPSGIWLRSSTETQNRCLKRKMAAVQ